MPAYRLKVDGQSFEFSSLAESLAFLDKAEQAARALANQLTRASTEQQRESVKLEPPKIEFSSRSLRSAVSETKRAIESIYRQAREDAELAGAFERETVVWLM